MEKVSPKQMLTFSILGPFDEKCPPVIKYVTKQQVFANCTPTHMTDS